MEPQKYFKEKLQYSFVKLMFIIYAIFMISNKAECQKSDKSGSVLKGGEYEKTFSTSRIGLAQSVIVTPKGEFHIVVQHRFNEISANLNEFFGLDYASTRLGFEYGIFNWLSAGIGRSMSVTTYDFDLKASILKQNESGIPLSLSWYVSFLENTSQSSDWTGHNSFGSRMSTVNQLFIARNQGILSFQVSPLWVHSNHEHRVDGPLDIFAVDLDSRIRLGEKIGLIAEYIPIITKESFTATNPFTIGLDIKTGGHQFQLIFSNSQGTNEKEITTNTFGSWSKGTFYFGFNLTRVFNPKED
jgi:hypothetical protein